MVMPQTIMEPAPIEALYRIHIGVMTQSSALLSFSLDPRAFSLFVRRA